MRSSCRNFHTVPCGQAGGSSGLQRFHDSAFQFSSFSWHFAKSTGRHTANYRRVEMIAITLSIAWLAAESAVSKNSCSKSKMAALRSVANRFLGTALTDSQKCTHLLVQIACQLQTNDGRQPPDRSSLKAHLQNGRGIQRLGDSHERLTDDAVMPPVIERALFTYCAQDNTFQFQTVAYVM